MNSPFKKSRRKSHFGDSLVICPVCKKDFLEISIRMHVYHKARGEVWQREMGEIKKTPHVIFYMKYTEGFRHKRYWIT